VQTLERLEADHAGPHAPNSFERRRQLGRGRPSKWAATKPDDLNQAHLTQAWLAVSNEPAALVTGQYFYHMRPRQPNPQVYDIALQHGLLDACERLSGVALSA
jgi:hypothetical protein